VSCSPFLNVCVCGKGAEACFDQTGPIALVSSPDTSASSGRRPAAKAAYTLKGLIKNFQYITPAKRGFRSVMNKKAGGGAACEKSKCSFGCQLSSATQIKGSRRCCFVYHIW